MVVARDRNSLEATLIDCSTTSEIMSVLPASGMSGREPVHETRHRAVCRCREYEMPMGWHDAVRKNCDGVAPDSLFKKAFERTVVARIVEQHSAFGCPVQNVEGQSGCSGAPRSGHRHTVNATLVPVWPLSTVLKK